MIFGVLNYGTDNVKTSLLPGTYDNWSPGQTPGSVYSDTASSFFDSAWGQFQYRIAMIWSYCAGLYDEVVTLNPLLTNIDSYLTSLYNTVNNQSIIVGQINSNLGTIINSLSTSNSYLLSINNNVSTMSGIVSVMNTRLNNINNNLEYTIGRNTFSAAELLYNIHNNTNLINTGIGAINSNLQYNDGTNTYSIAQLEQAQVADLRQLRLDNNNYLNSIYNKLNSIDWVNISGSFIGLSDSLLGEYNLGSWYYTNLAFAKIVINNFVFQDYIIKFTLPYNIADSVNIKLVNMPQNHALYPLYVSYNRYNTDIYIKINNGVSFSDFIFEFSGTDTFNFYYQGLSQFNISYLPSSHQSYWELLNYFNNISINHHLSNLDDTFNSQDIINAINDLELINHGDEKINVTITGSEALQTTGLIGTIRNMLNTGVSIGDFSNTIIDTSLLGWFTQDNADVINQINNAYVELSY